MKNLLIVVDEKQMGGVSILLEDMINLGVFKNFNTDILVLHNNGDRFKNIEDKVNIIYGTKYFKTVDLPIKEVLKTKKINLIFSKIRLVFGMKTGLIKWAIKRERKKILNKDYDIEIAFKDGFTALFTIFGNSVKKIHWLHYEYGANNPNKKYDRLFQKIMPKFNKFIAVSEGVKDAFLESYPVNDIKVIPNIVNKNKIIKLAKEKETIIVEKNKINIILVGRIHAVKGYDRFLKIVKRLFDEGHKDKVNINVIGDGPELEKILKLNKDLELNINFYGKLENPYKDIKVSDLFILPSLYEAFGLVILESFILNVPVLSTITGATKDIIDNKKNGLIVENTEEGLYQGLKYLIENPIIIEKYKENLKNYDYNTEKKIKEIQGVLM